MRRRLWQGKPEQVGRGRCGGRPNMDLRDLARALEALEEDYLCRNVPGTFDGGPRLGVVIGMTSARPTRSGFVATPESVTEELVEALDERIAETKDPGQRSRLIQVRDTIAGMARDLVVDVIGAALSKVITG
jgi:hypothetical protein